MYYTLKGHVVLIMDYKNWIDNNNDNNNDKYTCTIIIKQYYVIHGNNNYYSELFPIKKIPQIKSTRIATNAE